MSVLIDNIEAAAKCQPYRPPSPMRFIDEGGVAYLWMKINQRMNDIVANGIHSCRSCGAPYKGRAFCEYCGTGFFVDFKYDGLKEVQDGSE